MTICTFNINGTSFTIHIDRLRRIVPDSMLCTIATTTIAKDMNEKEEILLDFNPRFFGYVWEYILNGADVEYDVFKDDKGNCVYKNIAFEVLKRHLCYRGDINNGDVNAVKKILHKLNIDDPFLKVDRSTNLTYKGPIHKDDLSYSLLSIIYT